MAVYSYAEVFEKELAQKYARELISHDLTLSNPGIKFLNAQTIKIPKITVSGYKDHSRTGMGFHSGTITNDWEPKKLAHDRDIEFAIDPMDIDETNRRRIATGFPSCMQKQRLMHLMEQWLIQRL